MWFRLINLVKFFVFQGKISYQRNGNQEKFCSFVIYGEENGEGKFYFLKSCIFFEFFKGLWLVVSRFYYYEVSFSRIFFFLCQGFFGFLYDGRVILFIRRRGLEVRFFFFRRGSNFFRRFVGRFRCCRSFLSF